MSHINNKIRWCLNKGKKRGLVRIKSSKRAAKLHLNKAEHNLRALRHFDENGFSDWSISAGFYSIYHCFLSIGYLFGYQSKNQECTVALMRFLIVSENLLIDLQAVELLTHNIDNSVIDLREKYQYGVSTNADSAIINNLIIIAINTIHQTKELLEINT